MRRPHERNNLQPRKGGVMRTLHRDPALLSLPDLDAAIAQEFDLTAKPYASDPKASAELWRHLVDEKKWVPVINPWQVGPPYEVAIWFANEVPLGEPQGVGWGSSREEALARAALLTEYAARAVV